MLGQCMDGVERFKWLAGWEHCLVVNHTTINGPEHIAICWEFNQETVNLVAVSHRIKQAKTKRTSFAKVSSMLKYSHSSSK